MRHFDPYSQAIAKIERGFDQDHGDVSSMIDSGMVDPGRLEELFEEIEPMLFRYPAINASDFRSKVKRTLEP